MKTSKKNVKQKQGAFKKSRKAERKAKRIEKKVRKCEYYMNRTRTGKFVLNPALKKPEPKEDAKPALQKKKPIVNNNSVIDESMKKFAKEKNEERKLKIEMQKQRKQQLVQANQEEDRNIKMLEKKLKIKTKGKTIPKTFVDDGLDYLLEVCDSENLKEVVGTEMDLNKVNDNFDEDFLLMTGAADTKQKSKQSKKQNTKTVHESCEDLDVSAEEDDFEDADEEDLMDVDDEQSDDEIGDMSFGEEDEEGFSDDFADASDEEAATELGNKSGEAFDESAGSNDDDEETEMHTKKVNDDGTWEDIYGRKRDKEGNIIQEKETTGKYVPPAARAQQQSNSSTNLRLKRQLKGLMNRLAESNMHNISNQIENLYMANSRNDMNETLTSLMFESLLTNISTPERLLLEHVLLVTILHANVGSEIGAHFLQCCVKRFHALLSEDASQIEDKQLDNVVNVIAQLYNFKLFNSRLLYDILDELLKRFEEKHVECILNVLRNVGFTLRKDDPVMLKSLIASVQKRAADEVANDNPRVKFMLEILLAIKNNNVNKIPNYDASYSEHLKKILKSFVRKGNYVTQLNINLDDLLKADERGKWWVIGSAWTGKLDGKDDENAQKPQNVYSQKLLQLAKKQRMNTDSRRNIFCIIMSAEDYLDAFEKLLHLGLKNQQEREIINVLLHCCLSEGAYNPYYSVLAQKFCDYDRKYQMMIKYSIWDKLKALTDCLPGQISNLAKLLTHLFIEQGLPVSTLKIVQFSEMDKITLRFMRQILIGVLCTPDLEQCQEVFQKVAHSDKLKLFRESLRLFIHHFLLQNLKSGGVSMDEKQRQLLEERAHIVEKLLSVNDRRSKLV